MPTPEKETKVAELRELIQGTESVLLVDYRGLRVAEMNELRRRLREVGGQLMVIKNRLLKIGLADSEKAVLEDSLMGPTALAFGDDPAAVAKVLLEVSRDFPALELKPAFIEGQLLSAEEVTELAKLPSRDQLLAQIVGAVNSPITGLVYTLRGIISEFVLTLQSVAQARDEAEAAA